MKTYAVLVFIIIIVIVFFSNNKTSTSTTSNESSSPVEINNNYQRSLEYCSYCGNEISGGGTEQYGRLYCDLRCYADAN